MKRKIVSTFIIIVIFCMQLFGTKVVATNIDEKTARELGTYYLSVMMGGKEADEGQISLAYKFMNSDLNIPAAYVFNVKEQGFVIVSGSDLWYPILGYSTEGLLDTTNMAPAFKWYIEGLCGYICYSQNTGNALITDIDQEWDVLRYRKLPTMKQPKDNEWLMTSKWGQGYVDTLTYNKFCPHKNVDGQELTAYAGCVAIAMAQIMHYWQYPIEPVKDTIGYDCPLDGEFYEHVNIDMSEVTYDYANMPIRLSPRSPEVKIDATALLCYHAGVSVEMNYGLAGSAAYSANVTGALRDVFLYDTVIEWVPRTESNFEDYTEELLYTNEEWIDLLAHEIDEGRPMYYRGHSRSGSGRDAGGHAFVCDGVNSRDSSLFHFNWGWDGQPNVWCDVRNNNLSAGGYNFYFNQTAITHIQPREVVFDTVSISGVDRIEVLPAYPNPTCEQITIPYQFKDNEFDEVMKVYNSMGQLCETIRLDPFAKDVVIDVRRYPKGLYIYRIGEHVCRFLVM